MQTPTTTQVTVRPCTQGSGRLTAFAAWRVLDLQRGTAERGIGGGGEAEAGEMAEGRGDIGRQRRRELADGLAVQAQFHHLSGAVREGPPRLARLAGAQW
ncbi:hypothetical protein C5C04_01045 [Rathayibacter rathayi]|uniref:Uncharacterized protein n=1 Tax=Rathayibacter rathayi TaxID=33887 RepID=A0ABD6WCG4_RATRA|nr:hypothetical protein C5C04_01045 [Rathayibacter rathayi]